MEEKLHDNIAMLSLTHEAQCDIVKKTVEHVRTVMSGESSGHDWWHVYRVWRLARQIAQTEKADLFVVELAALLHDIADWKFHGGDETVGPRVARQWLESLSVSAQIIDHVCYIIKNISFKGAGVASSMESPEGMVVQDADRLDAIGAVGIARCFAYGGFKQREIYNPEEQHVTHITDRSYKTSDSNSVNHFYEKLLLLKDRMNTSMGKQLAHKRHAFMEHFLEQFLTEWDGNDISVSEKNF